MASKFKSIADRSKAEFKPRKQSRGVKLGKGLAAPSQTPSPGGGYIDYLRGMTGKNKSIPLTPQQWKKQGSQ